MGKLSDKEWGNLIAGKVKPVCIYHEGDAQAYYQSSPEIMDKWNAYAQAEADAFNNDPHRDTYDSTSVFVGWNRDGKCTDWCPQLYFPEWLEKTSDG